MGVTVFFMVPGLVEYGGEGRAEADRSIEIKRLLVIANAKVFITESVFPSPSLGHLCFNTVQPRLSQDVNPAAADLFT